MKIYHRREDAVMARTGKISVSRQVKNPVRSTLKESGRQKDSLEAGTEEVNRAGVGVGQE